LLDIWPLPSIVTAIKDSAKESPTSRMNPQPSTPFFVNCICATAREGCTEAPPSPLLGAHPKTGLVASTSETPAFEVLCLPYPNPCHLPAPRTEQVPLQLSTPPIQNSQPGVFQPPPPPQVQLPGMRPPVREGLQPQLHQLHSQNEALKVMSPSPTLLLALS
jgi:hypothetical protein